MPADPPPTNSNKLSIMSAAAVEFGVVGPGAASQTRAQSFGGPVPSSFASLAAQLAAQMKSPTVFDKGRVPSPVAVGASPSSGTYSQTSVLTASARISSSASSSVRPTIDSKTQPAASASQMNAYSYFASGSRPTAFAGTTSNAASSSTFGPGGAESAFRLRSPASLGGSSASAASAGAFDIIPRLGMSTCWGSWYWGHALWMRCLYLASFQPRKHTVVSLFFSICFTLCADSRI